MFVLNFDIDVDWIVECFVDFGMLLVVCLCVEWCGMCCDYCIVFD